MTVSRRGPSSALGAIARRLDRWSDGAFAALVFLPGALLVAVVLLPPILGAIGVSFFRIQLAKDEFTPFIGLRNYGNLAGDSDLLSAVPLTIAFSALTTVLTVPLSLAAALFLNRQFRGSSILGVAMLLPWAVAPIVTGLYWRFIFQAQFGIATAILNQLGIAHGAVQWLEDPVGAVFIAALATAWRSAPLFTVILLAALKTIPKSLYSAAKVDGAGDWSAFRYVTLPALRNSLLVVTILQIIVSLQVFDLLYTLTQGGPGTSTTVVIYYIFKTAFEQLNLGYSSAMAIFLTIVIAACTLLLVVARIRSAREPRPDDDLADAPVRPGSLAALAKTRREAGSDAQVRRRFRMPPAATRVLIALGGVFLVIWSVGPIAWILVASVQPEGAVTSIPLELTPKLQFSNFTSLLFDSGQFATLPWLNSIWVSLQIAVLTTAVTLFISALAAYPLARLRVPAKGAIMGLLIATQMVPAMVLAIPVLVVFQHLHLVDSVLGLVLVNTAFSIPIIIWLLRNVFEEVPRAIEAAARIDGCSRLGTLFRITVPAARSGIAAAAILMLIGTWNEFLFAVVLGNHNAVTVTRLIGLVQTTTGPSGAPPYTLVAAAGIIAIAPCVLLVAVFHRRIVHGLAEGYVKG